VNAVLGSLAAGASTLAGGLIAVRYRRRLGGALAACATILSAAAACELLPESLALARRAGLEAFVLLAALAGFAAFHCLERRGHGGTLPALALVAHSFLDGLGIGLAFQSSTSSGILVALGVVVHDFSDGFNVASIVITGRGSLAAVVVLLLLDVLAPIAGASFAARVELPPEVLSLQLALLAGFLLSIAVSNARRWQAQGIRYAA
jgi:zinc transporter ZupT